MTVAEIADHLSRRCPEGWALTWLNVAELELAVLARQVLGARIPDSQMLVERVTAWFISRNAKLGPVRWRFTTADARIKRHHLYPLLPA